MTRAGPLDLLGTVVGGLGYESLVEESDLLDLGEGQHVRLLRLEALIRLKEQVDRPKDRAQLPLLRRTLLERGGA